jgi:hypothetical protein
MTLQAVRKPFLLGVSVVCAGATLFFGYYGVRLVYTALTFEGEGSLGHVGLYIAAGLFPLGALICGALTYLAWKAAHRRRPGSATPA